MADKKKTGSDLDLKKKWSVREEPLSRDRQDIMMILGSRDGWLPCDLPCDIHTPLIKAGIIKDPVLADYCFSSEWTTERSWWFLREFDYDDLDPDSEMIELCIESIDTYGQIFINGTFIGESISAHHPFIADIKRYIIKGTNTLCVRCTTGLEKVDDAEMSVLNWATTDGRKASNGRGDERRAFVRRPQYTTGWDWGPKAVTCGIVKGAYIKCLDKAVIRGANIVTSETGNPAILDFAIEIDNLDIIRTIDADIEIVAKIDGKECAKL
ncbi:MAG: glycosyl hydrolase 2 galactose-binding domain-containing protein, partial [Saccharofermentanales bacterium]